MQSISNKPVTRRPFNLLDPLNLILILVILLCISSAFGTWQAYSFPKNVTTETEFVNFQHMGSFDYSTYVTPGMLYADTVQGETVPSGTSLYFTNIIDKIDVGFAYDFLPDRPVPISSSLEIVCIVTGPHDWKKEVPLYAADDLLDSFSVTFPLEMDQFEVLVNTVEVELGYRKTDFDLENAYQLRIEARVTIKGNTDYEPIEETFIQYMNIRKTVTTLIWDDSLYFADRKSIDGFSYRQQGQFSYVIKLKQNSLYDSSTITSPTYQPPTTIIQSQPEIVYLRITDVMQASFAYRFQCNQPIRNPKEYVTITAAMDLPNVWQKTFTLVPTTTKTKDFKLDFSVDVGSFNDYLTEITQETGKGAQEYELKLVAEVRTTADTDYGVIDDIYIHEMIGSMTPSNITWSREFGLTSTKAGAITSKQEIPNPAKVYWFTVQESRILFPILLVIFSIGIIFFIVDYLRRRKLTLRPSAIDREAKSISRKGKGFISEVREITEVPDAIIIPLDSPESLITTAQGLLKPILHYTDGQNHIYSVIDGTTVYQYILVEEAQETGTEAPA